MVHLGASDSFSLARIHTVMVAAGTNPQTLESEVQGGEEGHAAWVVTEGWIQLSNVLYKGQKQHPEHQALAPRSAAGGACLQGQLALN